MLTQSNPGAVVLSPPQVAQQMCYRVSEKSFFEMCLVIHFVLDCHSVQHDILRYLGIQRLISHEDTKNSLASAERLCENLFFVKMSRICYVVSEASK